MGELNQRDIEQQPGVWRMAHLDQHLAQPFHRAHDRGSAEALSLIGDVRCLEIR